MLLDRKTEYCKDKVLNQSFKLIRKVNLILIKVSK